MMPDDKAEDALSFEEAERLAAQFQPSWESAEPPADALSARDDAQDVAAKPPLSEATAVSTRTSAELGAADTQLEGIAPIVVTATDPGASEAPAPKLEPAAKEAAIAPPSEPHGPPDVAPAAAPVAPVAAKATRIGVGDSANIPKATASSPATRRDGGRDKAAGSSRAARTSSPDSRSRPVESMPRSVRSTPAVASEAIQLPIRSSGGMLLKIAIGAALLIGAVVGVRALSSDSSESDAQPAAMVTAAPSPVASSTIPAEVPAPEPTQVVAAPPATTEPAAPPEPPAKAEPPAKPVAAKPAPPAKPVAAKPTPPAKPAAATPPPKKGGAGIIRDAPF
jgi:hypothetical protein